MNKQIVKLALAFLIVISSCAWFAAALEISDLSTSDKVPSNFDVARACVVKGEVKAGDLEKLQAFIGSRQDGRTQLRCDIVHLESNGGNFSEAVKIMDYLFSSMIATSIEAGASCYSACAIIWLGGAVPDGHNLDNPHAYRRLNPSGILGFHAPYVLLSDGKYSNFEVMVNGTLSFKIAQELLLRFQDHRIPMWFAAKLLHPDPQNFYKISTVEDANLIGAVVPTRRRHKTAVDSNALGNICFSLSYWGKNRSAREDTEKTYSNNASSFRQVDEYIRFLNEGEITDVATKYIDGLASFLNATHAPANLRSWFENQSADIIGFADNDQQTKGALFRLWQHMSARLGPDFEAVAPGFLRWKASAWPNDYAYLFPSPGAVGAHDENTRDRPEWCLITLPADEDEDTPSQFYAIGTEFDPMQELTRLPPALLALPADTKLTDIEEKLASVEPAIVGNHPKPKWCSQAATETEKKICEDSELSGLDIEFERNFTKKKSTAKSSATSVAREMIGARNKCRSDIGCIKRAYVAATSRFNDM